MKRLSPVTMVLYLVLTASLLLAQVLPSVPAQVSAARIDSAGYLTSPLATPAAFNSPLPAPTPTSELKPTPVPPTSPAAPLEFAMKAEPVWAAPGQIITYTLTVWNRTERLVAGLEISSTVPSGLVYVPGSASGISVGSRPDQLWWAPDALAAGTGITSTFQLRAQGLTFGDSITNTAQLTLPNKERPLISQAEIDIAPPAASEAWLTPETGGWLHSPDERLLLRVPPGALHERTRFRYRAWPELDWYPSRVRFALELEAENEAGLSVREFAVPLELIVQRTPKGWAAGQAEEQLEYYDAATSTWSALATSAVPSRRQLRANTAHLTIFAAAASTPEGEFARDRMSRVRGAQADLYSRSITYDYPFDLPPGAGGLAPRLSLRYSSAGHSQHAGHYSYVGHGWDLAGADYVHRDSSTGEVTLVLGGRRYSLVSGAGRWFAKEDPLLHISFSSEGDPTYFNSPYAVTWTVLAGDGTRYTFEGKVAQGSQGGIIKPISFYWDCRPQGAGDVWRKLEWERVPLTRIDDTSGNSVQLSWVHETTDTMPYGCSPSAGGLGYHVRAIRLSQVSYNGAHRPRLYLQPAR